MKKADKSLTAFFIIKKMGNYPQREYPQLLHFRQPS